MKREKKTQISDFRYATGAARIGWPAVGEPMRPDDVMKVVEFLVPVAPGTVRPLTAASWPRCGVRSAE